MYANGGTKSLLPELFGAGKCAWHCSRNSVVRKYEHGLLVAVFCHRVMATVEDCHALVFGRVCFKNA